MCSFTRSCSVPLVPLSLSLIPLLSLSDHSLSLSDLSLSLGSLFVSRISLSCGSPWSLSSCAMWLSNVFLTSFSNNTVSNLYLLSLFLVFHWYLFLSVLLALTCVFFLPLSLASFTYISHPHAFHLCLSLSTSHTYISHIRLSFYLSHPHLPTCVTSGEHALDKVVAYFEHIRDARPNDDTFSEDMGEGSAAAAAATSAAAPGSEPAANVAAAAASHKVVSSI